VTDLAGVRLITYFPDEVDRVASLVQDEFEIDWRNSIDKRETLEFDRFGYLSLHYIVSHSPRRKALAEYRRVANCSAELQLRSVLQHTWAEIEHDLGYKTAHSIPRDLRRRFARIAGVLEIADLEFASLRNAIAAYERSLSERVSVQPSTVTIDQSSLDVLVRENSLVLKMHDFVRAHGGTVSTDTDARDFLAALARALDLLSVRTVEQLQALLESYSDQALTFMLCLYGGGFQGVGFFPGAPLWDLCVFLAIERGGKEGLEQWFAHMETSAPAWQPMEQHVACHRRARFESARARHAEPPTA